MSDIRDRLRAHMGKAEIPDILPDCREAADTIDALMKALEWYAQGGSNWDRGKRAKAAIVAVSTSGERS